MSTRQPDITIVRNLKAPPEKVYGAVTKPDQILQWWGPDAGTTVSAEVDLRPGGKYSIVFRLLDGSEHNPRGVYLDVVPNEKLVFTWEAPDWVSQVTILLRPIDIGTELTLMHENLPTDQIESHDAGWTGWADELQTYIWDTK